MRVWISMERGLGENLELVSEGGGQFKCCEGTIRIGTIMINPSSTTVSGGVGGLGY